MRIKTKNLIPDMVLARDLMDGGFVILRKGAKLSAHAIATIKKRGIRDVDVEQEGAAGSASGLQQVFGFAGERFEEYRHRKELLEAMFSRADSDDAQMQTLKYCVMGLLEEGLQGDR